MAAPSVCLATEPSDSDVQWREVSVATSRTWTDATGHRHAEATLLAIAPDEVRLRKSNGRLSTVAIERLSANDQDYIQHLRTAAVGPSFLALNSWIGRANSWIAAQPRQAAAGWSALDPASWLTGLVSPAGSGPVDPQSEQVPTNVIYVRVTRAFMSRMVNQTVRQQTPVADVILGTSIQGAAETTGRTELQLVPNNDRAVSEILFTGSSNSRTIGIAGPVQIHNAGITTFQARKRIAWSENGIQVWPAVSAARTASTTLSITTDLPRLRGRIARRIASRRVGESRASADWIAARHAEQAINRALDQRIEASLSQIASAVKAPLANLAIARQRMPLRMKTRTTADYLELVMLRPVGSQGGHVAPPEQVSDADVVVHVHSSVVNRAILDTELRSALASVFETLRDRQIEQFVSAEHAPLPKMDIRWSPDKTWLAIAVVTGARSGQSVVDPASEVAVGSTW